MIYHCKICENYLNNQPFVVREMMFGTLEKFIYFKCSSCGCIQITDPPPKMSIYYPKDNYYSLQHTNNRLNVSKSGLKNLIKKFLYKICSYKVGMFLLQKAPYAKGLKNRAWLKMLRQLRKNDSILDIGCGAGHLLQEMNIWGFTNLTGIDPFIEKDISYSSEVKILKQDVFNHTGVYDLIMLHHSYEHMNNPLNVLKKIYKMLNSKGILIIRIPVSDSFAWRKYGVNWFQIDAPRHFFLHTTKSIALLSKYAGFKLQDIVYDSTIDQFLKSEKYCRDISLYETIDFSSSYIKMFKKFAGILNERMDGDQACFILKKE